MKKRLGFWQRLIVIFGTIVLLACLYAVFIVTSVGSARSAVEKTKADLRKHGFKTDLAEFDFTVPANQRGFEKSLKQWKSTRTSQRSLLSNLMAEIQLMRRAGPDSAIVTWQERSLVNAGVAYVWTDSAMADEFNDPDFVEARAGAYSQPIRFNLDASKGMAMRLEHLTDMQLFSKDLGAAMVVDLHNEDRVRAWTNLVASTHLITAWDPEPTEASQAVRSTLVSMTFQATWEALQAGGWSDEQLAALQQDWEPVDFFKNMPETIAFKRAAAVDACENQRKEMRAMMPIGEAFKEMANSPREAPQILRMLWSQWRYLNGGIYEDETALLLFFRDREAEMRKAVNAHSWAAMKLAPGVMNQPLFTSKYASRISAMLNLRQTGMVIANGRGGVLGHAAEAESYRRLIITAIALERFRVKHEHYPAGLDELVPEFLKQPAIDFMDGQPLRYRLGVDGKFVLYSVGLDGVDDGGLIPKSANPMRPGVMVFRGALESGDMVWPRAATSNEVAMLRESELRELRQEAEFQQRTESEEYWNKTAARQAHADGSFVQPEAEINANSLNGREVSEILRNENLPRTNTLTEMLTLRPVITGAEPETITFEAPIKFDAVRNVGQLNLLIDMNRIEAADPEDGAAAQVDLSRATNGNCLVAWHTIYETPGRHTLQMGLRLESGNWEKMVEGPVAVMEVTNLCQFSESSAHFDSATGAWLFAKVPESKADYSVEMFATDGRRVKTISGNTSNGVIEVFWDLVDDEGKKLADHSFSTLFHIKLAESGRTQTLKGP